jgi:hypothetical protein
MKKFVLAAVLASASFGAQAVSPVEEARAKEFLSTVYPMIAFTQACKTPGRHEMLELSLDVAQAIAPSADQWMVESWYSIVEMQHYNTKVHQFAAFAKRNPSSPVVVQECAGTEEALNKVMEDIRRKIGM